MNSLSSRPGSYTVRYKPQKFYPGWVRIPGYGNEGAAIVQADQFKAHNKYFLVQVVDARERLIYTA